MRTRRIAAAVVLTASLLALAPARGDKAPAAPPAPRYVDDSQTYDDLTDRLTELAKAGKCLGWEDVKKKVTTDKKCRVAAAKPAAERLDPEDVYDRLLPSVFIVGSVVKEKDKDLWTGGRMATAWVLAADGVLVTNQHVMADVEEGEAFGVMDYKGNVYPVTDVLAANKAADVCVFRIAAEKLTPLPVAAAPARVGSWVGVLGHPGDRYYSFTQGAVTRYTKSTLDDGSLERWMAITADYAYGSSGSPVVNRQGAVVGMAAMTENLDYPEAEPKGEKPDEGEKKPAEAEKPKDPAEPKEPAPAGPRESTLQMVVKLTTPAADIRKVIGAD